MPISCQELWLFYHELESVPTDHSGRQRNKTFTAKRTKQHAQKNLRGIKINVVSPPRVSETLKAIGQDPDHDLPASVVAKAYVKSVAEKITGQVIDGRKA